MLLVAVALGAMHAIPAQAKTKTTTAPTAKADLYDEANPQNLTVDDLKGEAVLLMDAGTGRVLFEKNADERLYPASTTKVMTALLALEYGHLDDTVTVSKEISKLPKDSSLVPLKQGEKMSLSDLLYGLLLRSGNDAAVAIAVAVGGSVDNFVAMMNQKAEELGCTNTHFTNPHGYQDLSHYTTARDLALITRAAMKIDTFRQIVSTASYTLPATNKSKKRKISSTDAMLFESSPYYYAYAIGVKTGHHTQAGQCFVGAAEKDGATLISVTLKSSQSGKWTDTMRLMEYGFTQYKTYAFPELYAASPLYANVKSVDGADAEPLELALVPGGSIDGYSVKSLMDDLSDTAGGVMNRVTVQYSKDLTTPIREGDILGTLTLTAEDGSTLSGTLTASRGVTEIKAASTQVDVQPTPTQSEAMPMPARDEAALTSAQSAAVPTPTQGGTVPASAQSDAVAAPTQSEAVPASTQGEAVAASVQSTIAPSSMPVKPAPKTGALGLILWGILGLFALMILLIVLLRIRRAARRRRRSRELHRRQQQAAYARYRRQAR